MKTASLVPAFQTSRNEHEVSRCTTNQPYNNNNNDHNDNNNNHNHKTRRAQRPRGCCPTASNEVSVWATGVVGVVVLQNMQGLVTKIKKAQFPPLPAGYCAEWGSMVKSMIRRSPEERPSVSELTKLQFMHESYQAARHRAVRALSGSESQQPPQMEKHNSLLLQQLEQQQQQQQ